MATSRASAVLVISAIHLPQCVKSLGPCDFAFGGGLSVIARFFLGNLPLADSFPKLGRRDLRSAAGRLSVSDKGRDLRRLWPTRRGWSYLHGFGIDDHVFYVLCEEFRGVYGQQRGGDKRPLLRHLLNCVYLIGYIRVGDPPDLLSFDCRVSVPELRAAPVFFLEADPPAAVFVPPFDDGGLAAGRALTLGLAPAVL